MMPEETRTAKEIIEQRIDELLSDGLMEHTGLLPDGKPTYHLTDKGMRIREGLIKAFLEEKSEQMPNAVYVDKIERVSN